MFRGETALSAGAIQQFLPGGFFLLWLPFTPSARLEAIKEKLVALLNRKPSDGVPCPCAVCAVASSAIQKAMSNQLAYRIPQGVFAAYAVLAAPLERGLQMAVVILGQLAGYQQ